MPHIPACFSLPDHVYCAPLSNVDVEPGPLDTIKVSQESPAAVNGAPKVTAADGDGEPESTAHPLAPPAEGGDLKPPQFENGDNGRMRVDRVPTADVGKVSADEAAKMRKLSQGRPSHRAMGISRRTHGLPHCLSVWSCGCCRPRCIGDREVQREDGRFCGDIWRGRGGW